MWADSSNTMLVPSPNTRVYPKVGGTYWCSDGLGLHRITVKSITDQVVTTTTKRSIRMCNASFYDEKPQR